MQTDATTAETWLRNAPPGVRSVTAGRRWVYTATETGFLATGPYDVDRIELTNLEPDTYTLNYREGMQLDPQEAWDYLAGGERRIARTDGGREYRIVAGSHVQIRDDSGEWVAPHWGNTLPEQSYAIAPDEPATAPTEPDCCREARERVAELEAETADWSAWRDELDVDLGTADDEVTLDAAKRVSRERREALAKVADLEAKLAEAERRYEVCSAELQRSTADHRKYGEIHARVKKERDAVIAERDKLQRSLTLWQNAFRRTCMEERDSERHPNEWPAFMRQRFDKLRAQVWRLEAELEEWTSRFGPSAKDVADDWAQYRATTITLPTDTTTPLDLAQRAVALMGGRRCRMGKWTFWLSCPHDTYDTIVAEDDKGRFYEDTAATAFFDPMSTVTLAPAPEPEPERRKLTFGEAVEAIDVDHELIVRAVIDGETYEMRGYGVSHDKGNLPGAVVVWIDPLATVPSHRMQRITPAMLTAEWEACS